MVNKRRVVVTGLGVISSIGIGKEAFWKGLLDGRSGISRVDRFDTSSFETHIGGEVKHFNPEDFFDKKIVRHFGRATQFTIAASHLALADAKLAPEIIAGSSASVCLGTTMAEAQALEAVDERTVRSGVCSGAAMRRYALQYPSCMIATQVASIFRLKGRAFMIPTACAAGNYSIAYGGDLIRSRKCDVVIAGGVDPFSRTAFTGFSRIFALAPDRCQPFDKNRKGIVVGEGAGIVILESLEYAKKRGVDPYAELLGYGTSCDAHHMTIPSREGIVRAIRNALNDAHVLSEEVDYISAHGTGTAANDRTECAAVADVFGEKSSRIPISSIKSMLGHAMGAASALEAIACALVAKHDRIPPTINFETPDPNCPIDCVPNRMRESRADIVINNSFAFGGNNACIVLQKYKP